MSARSIIIDCDPGQDDAINLLLALSSPDELDVLGITTVAGNVPLDATYRNARIMCSIADRPDASVYAGCDRPIRRELMTAEHVHGKTGIDGVDLFEPEIPLQSMHAVDFIIDTLLAEDSQSVTLVPTGPLTNIAKAMQKNPSIVSRICDIVLMGGAMREAGNHSPSAEFNMLVDPDAADIVFRCGRPITVMGLDVTHQVLSTAKRIDAIRALENPVADAVCGMLEFFHHFDTDKYGSDGAPLHDPCTVAFLLRPDLFQTRACNITVETESELTLGHTAVDFWSVTDRPKNVDWVYSVNADGFYSLLTERLGRYG